MTRRDLLEQARASLRSQRLRALLSALGIVCGTAAVVAALAIGEGARRRALDEIGALGLANVYVRAEQGQTDPDRRRPAPVPALTVDDAAAVAARAGAVESFAAVRLAAAEVGAGARSDRATLAGVSAGWDRIAGVGVARGRWLRAGDDRRRVAVIGMPLARALFGERDPVGQYVSAGDVWYRVVGVLAGTASRGQSGAVQVIDPGRAAFVPLAAMELRRGPGDTLRHVSEVVFRVRADADVMSAAAAIESRLRERHKGGGDFRVVVPRALLDARLRAERSTHALLLGIGALALLIGGVGIMNIMLANVVERTQEIGLRRAFGATRPQIVAQFAVEAALLCAAGGLAGVPAGAAFAWGMAALGGWPVAISVESVVLAVALAAGVGLGFGIYPARRAAALDPAAALRAE